MLTVVPTPIGNLEDITLRALDVLRQADLILAEDTRTTAVLLRHYDIHRPLQSYHKFNEHRAVDSLVDRMLAGENFALVSDAGTPGISDPGFLLARECVRRGVEVQCLPGPTAVIPALVVSGLPCDRFVFEGFLPQKKGRLSRLTALARDPRTVVFYESPHRVVRLLEQMAQTFGPSRQLAVCRELTKIHEQVLRTTVADALQHFTDNEPRGEFVIVAAGYDAHTDNDQTTSQTD